MVSLHFSSRTLGGEGCCPGLRLRPLRLTEVKLWRQFTLWEMARQGWVWIWTQDFVTLLIKPYPSSCHQIYLFWSWQNVFGWWCECATLPCIIMLTEAKCWLWMPRCELLSCLLPDQLGWSIELVWARAGIHKKKEISNVLMALTLRDCSFIFQVFSLHPPLSPSFLFFSP